MSINMIFNNLTGAAVAALMQAYREHPDYDDTVAPSIGMTAADYLAMLDNPAVGADPAPSAAAVFTAGIIAEGAADNAAPPVSAAAAFGNADLSKEPVISMTELAGEFTLADYHEQGWDNAGLLAAGYIVITQPAAAVFGGAGAPNGPGATGTPQAPAQESASTKAAPPPAPASTGATGAPPLLDTNGVPWDERIHASTRTTTTAGVWKKRKGVDEALYTQLTEELRAANVQPFTPLNASAAPPPPAKTNAAPPPPAKVAAAPPPPAKVAPAPPPAEDTLDFTEQAPDSFAKFCRFVTGSGFKPDQIGAVCGKFGLPGLGRMAEASNFPLMQPMYEDFLALRDSK